MVTLFDSEVSQKRRFGGRKLAYELVVNHVPLCGLNELLGIFQEREKNPSNSLAR